MTVQELYNHITTHLTPEQALMKMLEGNLITYEKLKIGAEDHPVHPISIITLASMDLGWSISIENDQEFVRGMTIGSEDYIKGLFHKDKSGDTQECALCSKVGDIEDYHSACDTDNEWICSECNNKL